jgi:hypothetical protein
VELIAAPFVEKKRRAGTFRRGVVASAVSKRLEKRRRV